jgi:hypothetical protein
MHQSTVKPPSEWVGVGRKVGNRGGYGQCRAARADQYEFSTFAEAGMPVDPGGISISRSNRLVQRPYGQALADVEDRLPSVGYWLTCS